MSRRARFVPVSVCLVLAAACLTEDIEARFQEGFELLYENRYEDAGDHFLAIARAMVRADLPDADVWRARALYEAGRIDHLYLDQPRRAVGRLREALQLDPQAPYAFAARYEIALIFHDRLMDYRNAALEFERLIHEFPDAEGMAAYQYRVAQSYFLLRDFDQARSEARVLIQKWSKDRYANEARLLIANSYYLEGRFGEAVTAHKKLQGSSPDVPIRARSLFELGMCYLDLGDKARAEGAFLAALKAHPRPDLVQMQLKALRQRMDQEDQRADPRVHAKGHPTRATTPALSSNQPKDKRKKEPQAEPKAVGEKEAKAAVAPKESEAEGKPETEPGLKSEPSEAKRPATQGGQPPDPGAGEGDVQPKPSKTDKTDDKTAGTAPGPAPE